MENYNVSFGARRIGTANIRAKIDNKWKEIPVSFVRLHPKTNKGDKEALASVTKMWQGKNLSGSIQEQSEISNDPVFALTTQNENFKNINPKKILGMLTTNDFKRNSEDTAEIFVQSLCNTAPIVIFSAAHPGQGGTNHVNEQPFEYWAEKFKKHGYNSIEIRPLFCDDLEIGYEYRTNITIYAKTPYDERIRQNLF